MTEATKNAATTTTGVIVEDLLASPLFKDMSYFALARVLPTVARVDVRAGEEIVSVGKPADHLFLVTRGSIRLLAEHREQLVGRSECFGEETVLNMANYTLSARAEEDSVLLRIPREQVRTLTREDATARLRFNLSLVSHLSADKHVEEALTETVHATKGPGVLRDRGRHKARITHVLGWLLTLAVPGSIIGIAQQFGIQSDTSLFSAVVAAALVMWLFDTVPVFVPPIFGVLAVLVLGIAPPGVVLSGFTSEPFFMALGVFGISAVVANSGLPQRIVLSLVARFPRNQFFSHCALLLTGIILTPFVPRVPRRVAAVMPFYHDMVRACSCGRNMQANTHLAVAAYTGSSMFSPLFLTAHVANFLVLGLLSTQAQEQFHWLYWLYAASVTGATMLLLYGVISLALFWNRVPATIPAEIISAQRAALGRLSRQEWTAVVSMVILMLGIVTSSFHKIGQAWLAVFLLNALMLFSYFKPSDFRKSVDWPFLMYLGGLIGVVNAMRYLQIDNWLGDNLKAVVVLMQEDLRLFVMLLSLTLFLGRFVMPVNVIKAVAAAVILPLAGVSGVNLWLVGFVIVVMGDCWVFPYQSNIYQEFEKLQSEDQPFDRRRFLWFNGLMNVVRFLAIYLSLPFWHRLGIL